MADDEGMKRALDTNFTSVPLFRKSSEKILSKVAKHLASFTVKHENDTQVCTLVD